MSLPVALQGDYVSLTLSITTQDISVILPENPADAEGKQPPVFGLVDSINGSDSSQSLAVGNTVMFKMEDAILVRHSGTDYYLVKQSDIIFIENVVS